MSSTLRHDGLKGPFLCGDWLVSPATNTISRGELKRQMEPRAMDVLAALAARGSAVVSPEDLLQQCWGSTLHGDNPVHKTIAQLRRLLDDSATAPRYIATIRKRGYQIVARLLPVEAPPAAQQAAAAGAWTGSSPFRGLSAFDESHAAVFFGRADATAQLVRAVGQRLRQGLALQLVLGPSGSGKSSLVCAGLLPALAQADGQSSPRLLSSTRLDLREAGPQGLMTALAGAMLDWQIGGAQPFPGASASALGQRLAAEPQVVAAELHALLAAQRAAAPDRRAPCLALFVDSFEAVFSLPGLDEADRRQLLQLLEALARAGGLLVLLACRNDFYPRIAAYPLLMHGKQSGGHFDLAPPTRAELAQIIALPAAAARLSFDQDPGTQERLDQVLAASAADNPDALPLLQYTLQELYHLRRSDGVLGFDAFRQLGGIEGAIGHRAEQVIQALAEPQRAGLARVLSLVVTLSAAGEQTSSRRATWADLRDDSERALVQALVEARLFVSALLDQQPGFGVAHEAVLRRWPRVQAWIAEHRHALGVRGAVHQQAARWHGEGRPADLLLPPGRQLDEARRLLHRGTLSLSDTEAALIDSSGQRERRRRRLRAAALTLMLALATLATVAGLLASHANGLAQQRRAEAEGLLRFMLGDFADKLRPLARLDLLDAVSAKAMQYLSDSRADDASAASLTQRAQALQVIAEVRIARGDTPAAQAALLAAQDILRRQLERNPGEHQLWTRLGANAFWQGKIKLEQSDWAGAEQLFQQYRTYSEQFYAAEPDNADGWIELSYSLNNLGTLALKRGDAAAAAQAFERSVELKTRALARKPGDKSLAAELADSLSWVASAQERQGRLPAAQQLYERERQMVQGLRDAAPGEALWQNRLAIALQHLGGLKLVRGDDRGALRDLQQAEALLAEVLRGDAGNRDWQRNRAYIELEQQRILLHQEAPERVLARLRRIDSEVEALVRLDPKKVDWSRLQAISRQRMGDALLRLRRPDEARAALAASEQQLRQLLARNGADQRSRDALVQTMLLWADLQRGAGDANAALAACGQARALLPSVNVQSADFRVLDSWVRTGQCLGDPVNIKYATSRLNQMGYSETAFQQFLSNFSNNDKGIRNERTYSAVHAHTRIP